MKSPRILLSALSLVLGTLSLSAQTPAAKPAAVVKPMPVSSVAWINSDDFTHEEGGIKVLVRVLKELELEFSGTQDDLSLLSSKLQTIIGELNRLQAGGETNAEAIKQKQTEGLKLQQELQTRQQQAQQAINAAQQEKQGPISQEIGKALTVFAKERDIGILFDIAKMGDSLIVAKPELEVTEEFITYFNKLQK